MTFTHYKIQASILLKHLRSNNLSLAEEAAKRVRLLHVFKHLSLVVLREQVRRKHALAVIALENTYISWEHLKLSLEPINFYPEHCVGFLNHWFSSYGEAKAHLMNAGGYLLPHKNQFFVCGAAYIQALGLDPKDADWQAVGFDWVEPSQPEAWLRLARQVRT